MKSIVIYYSFTGNSKKVAEYVKEKMGSDILCLEPKVPFSSNYDEVVEEWQNNDIKRDVEIKNVDIDFSKYDEVILITSTWWYGISPVMKRFLKEYDLSGKDVIVAGCNAGWLGHVFKDYETLLSSSNIKGELDLVFGSGEYDRQNMKTSFDEIDNWINKLN